MSSQSSVDLVNRALVRIGSDRISNFTANSVASQLAGEEYEARVGERLCGVMPGWPPPGGSAFEWRFAMVSTALGAPTATAPADSWDYAYNIPADLLAIRALRRNDRPVDFTRYGAQIYTNEDADLVIDYTFRQVEVNFPPYFTAALVEDLAGFFALAVKRDNALARTHTDMAVTLWAAARLADSKAMTPRVVKASRVVAVRFGG